MKKVMSTNTISHLSFPDFEVLSMTTDLETKKIRIEIEGAVIAEKNPIVIGPVTLCVTDWVEISIRKFSSNRWSSSQDTLREICEFVSKNGSIILRGFGKSTNQWIEYVITDAIVEAQFDETC